jgi:serine/threonine protein kinase
VVGVDPAKAKFSMTPEQWNLVDELLDAALERPPSERIPFLNEACKNDEVLRREVDSLIRFHEQEGTFPDALPAADTLADDQDASIAGRTIAHFKILRKIGASQMGVVYLAQDTSLPRKVALKVLPQRFTRDPQRIRRFRQEAFTASTLSHPNILTVYEIGQTDGSYFIATEFIEGETLRGFLGPSKVKPAKVLDLMVQVASALAAGHAAGIVHRDIKPENIMVRPDGYVKVIDFGIAKLVERREVNDHSASSAARITTEPGLVIGTVRYMSPEQARGLAVDARTDIFSLGVVIYEMLTGHRPFDGETTSDVISAILEREPAPCARYCPDMPAKLQWIVNKALRKDKEERYQTAKELLSDLKDVKQELEIQSSFEHSTYGALAHTPREHTGALVKETNPERTTRDLWNLFVATDPDARAPVTPAPQQRLRWRLMWSVGIMALVVAGAVVARFFISDESLTRPSPTVLPLTSYPGQELQSSFSPDGTQVAFSWTGPDQDNFDIYVKVIGTEPPTRLTSDAARDCCPAWSPDGRWVAFVRGVSGDEAQVILVPPLPGHERKVGRIQFDTYHQMVSAPAWSPDSKFLIISDKSSSSEREPYSLFLLSIDKPERKLKLTNPPASSWGDAYPALSPDGRSLVFSRWAQSLINDLYLLALSESLEPVGERRLTFDNQMASSPVWTVDGRDIIFASAQDSGGASLRRIAPIGSGNPVPLPSFGQNGAYPAISRQGHRLSYSQLTSDSNIWRLEVSDPTGKPLISSTRVDDLPQFSPDGRRIAFESSRSGNDEIWVCNSNGSSVEQLTSFRGPIAGTPRWSPGGETIVFDLRREGYSEIYVIPSEGGAPQRLTHKGGEVPSWSRDGKWIYFASKRSGPYQVWKIPVNGGAEVPVTRDGGFAAFESPDGFIYYAKSGSNTSLWKTPVNGGAEIQVLESLSDWSNFAIIDEGIYFIPKPSSFGGFSIQFFSFLTLETTSVATIHKPLFYGLAVSPDKRRILYTQTDEQGSDLMLVENFR